MSGFETMSSYTALQDEVGTSITRLPEKMLEVKAANQNHKT